MKIQLFKTVLKLGKLVDLMVFKDKLSKNNDFLIYSYLFLLKIIKKQ
jgi:hypothetical protein